MAGKPKYYLIDAEVMPAILHKALYAKQLLDSGSVKTASEAADKAGLSRSAFYKYKDSIRPFFDKESDKVATFYIELNHTPGILSSLLNLMASCGLNILTINQNIPINGVATVTISAQTANAFAGLDDIIEKANNCEGVVKFGLLAGN